VTALLILLATLLAPGLVQASGASDESRTESFSYDRVARVQVLGVEIYSVQVTGVSGQGFEGEVIAPPDARYGIEHRRSGDTVQIRAYRKGLFLDWLGAGSGTYRLVLRVPASCELEIATATGSITVSGVSGPKKLETGTGSIAVRDSDGDVLGTSGTGSQVYAGVSGDIAAKAGTGSVTLEGVRGTISAETSTGTIQGKALRLVSDSSFTAHTGSVTLDLAQSLDDFSFQLRTDTGSIKVGDAEARGRLVIGAGKIKLQAETDTGSVRISGE
jgi:hypothetical protein